MLAIQVFLPLFLLVVQPSVTVEKAALDDSVVFSYCRYNPSTRTLSVAVSSSNPNATLKAFVAASDELLGALDTTGDGRFTAEFVLDRPPSCVTVRSSAGGMASASVETV